MPPSLLIYRALLIVKMHTDFKTAYPRLPADELFKPYSMQKLFSISEEEKNLSKMYANGLHNQLNFLVLLKVFDFLTYFPKNHEISDKIYLYIGAQLDIESMNIKKISKSAKYRYYNNILQMRNFKSFNNGGKEACENSALKSAQTLNNLTDIINVCIEDLRNNKYELPSYDTIYKIALKCKKEVNNKIFSDIHSKLGEDTIILFQKLLQHNKEDHITDFNKIKLVPKKVTPNNTKKIIEHVKWLLSYGDMQKYLANVSKIKVKQFAMEALATDAGDMRQIRIEKRYSVIACMIYDALRKLNDSLTKTLINTIKNISKKAKEKLLDLRETNKDKTKKLLYLLHNIISDTEKLTPTKLKKALQAKYNEYGGANNLTSLCDDLIAYNSNNPIFLIKQFFLKSRQSLLEILEILHPYSNNKNCITAAALKFIIKNKDNPKENIPLADLNIKFLSKEWQEIIVTTINHKKYIVKNQFEAAVFGFICKEITAGNLHIKNSALYGDILQEVDTNKQLGKFVIEYCNKLGLPNNGEMFIQGLKEELTNKSKVIDDNYNAERAFSLTGSKKKLKKYSPKKKTNMAKKIAKIIEERMPKRSLLEILSNSFHYTKWTNNLSLASGNSPRKKDNDEKKILTTFAYGTSLGPTQLSIHVSPAISAQEISWINKKYVTPQALDQSNKSITEICGLFDIANAWGDGSACAADGTFCNIYDNNLFAEHHFRYRKTGGVAYHHISDQYVALFSTFIACGVWEAVEIIDALLKMDENERPEKIHADTQGQSTLVFAISYLLGINLMPRIRNWKKITLYKPNSKIKYKNIEELFSGKAINWKLIEEGWVEIMNIILAIHKGDITSSMILRKLNSKSKNNNLYKSLQELGRVIRTLFLLEYISNLDLRQQITDTTNKAEGYNGISKWLRFGNEHAIVASNDSNEQEKAIKYNTLLVNAVVLQNLVDMSKIIQDLINQGVEIKMQDLMYLSPYKHAHIKRFGEYFLQILEKPAAIKGYMNLGLKLAA